MIEEKVKYKSRCFFWRVRWGQAKGKKYELRKQHNKSKAFQVIGFVQEGEELKRYNRLGGDSKQKRQRQQKTKTNNIKQLPELFEELKGRNKSDLTQRTVNCSKVQSESEPILQTPTFKKLETQSNR